MTVASTTPTSQVILGHNIKLDNYTGISGDLHGVEPYVAVGKDGTIHIAWIGLKFTKSTTYFDQGPRFETQIWYAKSTDGGASFSEPIAVSSPGSNFDPSIALSPKGDVLIAYDIVNGDIILARKSSEATSFQQTVAVLNPGSHYFDRPWVAVNSTGAINLVWSDSWDNNFDTFWSVSTDDGQTFTPPVDVARGLWPTGIIVDETGTLHVSLLGWSPGSSNPDQVWYARRPTGSNMFEVKKLTNIQTPYRLAFRSRQMFHPGPAVAAEGKNVFLVYASNNGKSLFLVRSDDSGARWTSPILLRSSSGLMEMPWLTALDGTLILAWRENSSGFWNTYYGRYTPGAALAPVKLSDQNGYAADVLNWHGDFLGVAFLGKDRLVVVWSDGRNLPINYGYGHVFIVIVEISMG